MWSIISVGSPSGFDCIARYSVSYNNNSNTYPRWGIIGFVSRGIHIWNVSKKEVVRIRYVGNR